jgi:hypothetical protein
MQSIVAFTLGLFAVASAVNNVGNLELKQAFDAAWIRMLSDGTYDSIVYADTGNYPQFYYGDCAVPTSTNMDTTYP